jgi:hypothetical protein
MGLALGALLDRSAQVTRAARELLLAARPKPDPDVLSSALRSATTAHGRRNALLVLASLDHWTRLPALLQVTTFGDDAVAELARRKLTSWVVRQNRVFHGPGEEVAQASQQALQRAAIDDTMRGEIGAILRARRRLG